MIPKQKAEELVHRYRMLFMNDGEDYGNEIIVSLLSKQSALISVDVVLEGLNTVNEKYNKFGIEYYQQVKQEIIKL